MEFISTYKYEIKKSKFIAYFYLINSQEEATKVLSDLKKEHKKARHIPYAYKVKTTAKKSDDKEPNGTAGTPLYNLLENNHLENCLIAVVRYFGGIKLGAGGLLRAYVNAANNAIKRKEEKWCH